MPGENDAFALGWFTGTWRLLIGRLRHRSPMASHPLPPIRADSPDTHARPSVRRGAKAMISSSSRVLLVRERHSDGRSFWTLPGGGVRPRESLVAGLRRELLEELRCDAVVGEPVAAFWYAHRCSVADASRYTVFSCAVDATVRPARSEGILAAKWVAPGRLPVGTIPQVRRLLQEPTHVSGPKAASSP